MSKLKPTDTQLSIMAEINQHYPELHKDLVKRLAIINDNISRLPPEDKRATKKNLFRSIADRLTDVNNIRKRFLQAFKMEGEFQEWDVDRENIVGDMRPVLEADALFEGDTSITVEDPNEIVIGQHYGTARNVSHTFGREPAKKTPTKTATKTATKKVKKPEKLVKPGKKGGKTNRNKKMSKTRKSLKRRRI
jgi:hypothetical protein